MYVNYRCKTCGAEFIMPTENLKIAEISGRYIACPFGHKMIETVGRFGDLKQCMEEQHRYRREHGRIKQIE
jgi:DNA-directed RNA polymerase subunit RPC12/RpoP